ncbi:MAG TPA: amylo-alpha-1,6-glucosidase [Candidatus Polarisedimenticolaceae bacterium]|nr:amylo-alpha-1,6-glucosidase [Candidatus Polarisedimenticolaceae bacterium]
MTISFDASITRDFDAASRREWIEANGLGGYASGTVSGAATRRYHGLLVAATHPPVGRMVLLSKLAETLVVGGERFELDANAFPGAVHPRGFEHLASFALTPFPTFVFEADGVRLRKTVAAIHGENTTVVTYELLEAPGDVHLELRPLIAYREDHALQRANDGIGFANASFEDGVFRARPYPGTPELLLSVPGARFVPSPDWYYRFEYAQELERGLPGLEDLFSHGVFHRTLSPGECLGVIASIEAAAGRDARELMERQKARRKIAADIVSPEDPVARTLALAADTFVVRRGDDLRTIIAGYPWFADWGRDTMIALPGVCLATGRLDDARKILRAYADATSQGMLPNRFPDTGAAPEYNAVDATLWFFVAAWRYLEAAGDEPFVLRELLPVFEDVISWHERGTRFGIRVDDDGLLRAGAPGTQLTWMDAKIGDWVVTPRSGKPVEVEGLWINALAILAELRKRSGRRAEGEGLAKRVEQLKVRFVETFWNDETGYLDDVVDGDHRDPSIRPNAIVAIALPFPLLTKEKAKSVLAVAEEKLLTPVGLRSLAQDDPAYRGRYEGGPSTRDAAYHQGTVWSWLLGPYVDALVRVHGAPGKTKARKALAGLIEHLKDAGAGSISEIFDGDAPHAPRGCPSQAWSVGELLRAHRETAVAPRKKPYKLVTPKIGSDPISARARRTKGAAPEVS